MEKEKIIEELKKQASSVLGEIEKIKYVGCPTHDFYIGLKNGDAFFYTEGKGWKSRINEDMFFKTPKEALKYREKIMALGKDAIPGIQRVSDCFFRCNKRGHDVLIMCYKDKCFMAMYEDDPEVGSSDFYTPQEAFNDLPDLNLTGHVVQKRTQEAEELFTRMNGNTMERIGMQCIEKISKLIKEAAMIEHYGYPRNVQHDLLKDRNSLEYGDSVLYPKE